MIFVDGLPYVFGERIKLPVVPVDPRDLFRGDYVVLGYDFNNINGRVPALADREAAGRDVYVALKPQGDHYITDSMSTAGRLAAPISAAA